MPQTLYRFGVDSTAPAADVNTPIPVVTNAEINILWSSWCDLIHTTLTHDFERTVIYLGTGLNAAQQLDLQSDFLISGLSGMRHSTLTTRELPRFFGTAMHDGVRGYVVNRKVTMYGTPGKKNERADTSCDVASWEIPGTTCHPLAEVSMCSDDSLLVVCTSSPGPESGWGESESTSAVESLVKGNDEFYDGTKAIASRASSVNLVRSLQDLREYCSTETPVETVADFAPTRLVVNATTSTILDEDGRVHTRTTDPRYPACLGRPYTGTSTFEPVPYLSETRINKIASGGYMTAAISEDGELFLWGQTSPGTEGELGVLRRPDSDIDTENSKDTAIWDEPGQDEDVKCLTIRIDGRDAYAYDVAVGFGHVLVAAKNEHGQRVVFAGGCGENGQLGLGKTPSFMRDFEEVVTMRGKQVVQLAAAGWSSFLVVDG